MRLGVREEGVQKGPGCAHGPLAVGLMVVGERAAGGGGGGGVGSKEFKTPLSVSLFHANSSPLFFHHAWVGAKRARRETKAPPPSSQPTPQTC